jgi:hypothetical protein
MALPGYCFFMNSRASDYAHQFFDVPNDDMTTVHIKSKYMVTTAVLCPRPQIARVLTEPAQRLFIAIITKLHTYSGILKEIGTLFVDRIRGCRNPLMHNLGTTGHVSRKSADIIK